MKQQQIVECDFCGGYVKEEEIEDNDLIALPTEVRYACLTITTKDDVKHKFCSDCFYKALSGALETKVPAV